MSTVNQLMLELHDSRLRVEQLLASNARLTKEVEELREGACRYHCRTAKENYFAGFDAADGDKHISAKEAWREHTASS